MSTCAALLAAGLLVSLSGAPPAGAAEPPSVVVSIKPLYGLVARVMEGVGEPALLVTGAGSLHTYSLKPSQALSLESADLVVWVGPSLETFLSEPLAALARDAAVVEAEELPGIVLLAPREGGTWEAHDHDDHDHDEAHDHDQDHHGGIDGHLFLDPGNAQVIAGAVAEALAARDPENAAVYRANATALQRDLTALDQEIEASLADLRGRPYLVFHDAYQYFEAHFGIPAAGSITVSPDRAPGARRLAEVREKILGLGAVCVFTEPDFQPALVETLVRGTKARVGILDPEAAALESSPETYDRLLRDLAAGLRDCLSAG